MWAYIVFVIGVPTLLYFCSGLLKRKNEDASKGKRRAVVLALALVSTGLLLIEPIVDRMMGSAVEEFLDSNATQSVESPTDTPVDPTTQSTVPATTEATPSGSTLPSTEAKPEETMPPTTAPTETAPPTTAPPASSDPEPIHTETIFTERHTPNDIATSVSCSDWDVDNDIGITGRRYGGGWKIDISNFFADMGSTVESEITSQIVLTLPAGHNDTYFEGIIVLDQSMYGSQCHGTIRILVDNVEVFTTGEIGGDCTIDFPFYVDITNAATIIVEANVVVANGSFCYGVVT